jgi:hypothetical protein
VGKRVGRSSSASPAIPPGFERHTLLYGGARSGKTFLLCYAVLNRALSAKATSVAEARTRSPVPPMPSFDRANSVLYVRFIAG